MDLVGVGFWIDRRYLSANAARSRYYFDLRWIVDKRGSRTDAIISSSYPAPAKSGISSPVISRRGSVAPKQLYRDDEGKVPRKRQVSTDFAGVVVSPWD